MPKCKPGDLAEFLPQAERNAGRRVVVDECCVRVSNFLRELVWHVKPLQTIWDPIQGCEVMPGDDGHAPDRLLRPIPPDEIEGDHSADHKVDTLMPVGPAEA